MPQCSQEEKLVAISKKTFISVESCRSKLIRNRRSIKESDYNEIKKIDSCLLLDTEKLISKLILRVDMDLVPNERFVLYMMLCCLCEEQEWVSIDYLIGKVTDGIYNQKKIENILKNCKVAIDDSGEKKSLFKSQREKYSIDLTVLISYTDYDLM